MKKNSENNIDFRWSDVLGEEAQDITEADLNSELTKQIDEESFQKSK